MGSVARRGIPAGRCWGAVGAPLPARTAPGGKPLRHILRMKSWGCTGSHHRPAWLKSSFVTFLGLSGTRKPRHEAKGTFATSTTVDSNEMKKFQILAHKWWDEQGAYSPLHSLNDLRVPFIRDNLLKTTASHHLGSPLSGMKILDVGCGGGLLSEPLGRLGALVTGIDPLEDNVKTAQQHKRFDPALDQKIQYRACSLEEIAEESAEAFDAVVASEVVEHVIDLETFIKCCHRVLKPRGSLFITTINKTPLSYVLGIIFAEQIAGIVPKGTHDWEKFVSPEELESLLEANGLMVQRVRGMLFNPLSGYWNWTENTSLNYAAHAVKSETRDSSGSPSEMEAKEHQGRTASSTDGHGEPQT
ncbi:ubiquinone biosynthesis O-methyltransferase, mitochondrial [Ornithorhynchus anatinus]|uniref:Ubiquinone biosynthesis O-methyltransferase, mitochondrial n=1 Tax=Ornithorhynchus anatinus TaxID=9258 RepID=A0A6I8PJ03_ORNAN|nr:ubiquinone biosynthesis O-methyltransferase, mitochondrial [Ornithorhynchus anatinus]